MKQAVGNVVLSLRNIQYSWSALEPPVLDIGELTVAQGERIFLHGPSGSGKTTLLNVIAAVLKPQAGSVEVDGVDLGKLSGSACDRFRADQIGLVFQQFNLLPFLSVADNVQLPCRFSPQRKKRALAEGRSLNEETERLLAKLRVPERLIHSRSVMHLSVGQQQRVAVARALIGSPSLIIADEPTSALDKQVQDAFLELLFQEVEEAASTLIFVSHDISLSDKFDRIIDFPVLNRAALTHANVSAEHV